MSSAKGTPANRKLTLISATPSPYARKVRISLQEKEIPFTLQTEVPWNSTTKTPDYNPLEKLPVLIVQDDTGKAIEAVYESRYIMEWIETSLTGAEGWGNGYEMESKDRQERLLARQVEVTTDAMCDALVLLFFEKQRQHPSAEWQARQQRKVDGGIKWLNGLVTGSGGFNGETNGNKSKEFLIGDKFGLADIAAGSVLGYMKVRAPQIEWQKDYPALKTYMEGLEGRQSFRDTTPVPQTIDDKIV